MSSKHKIEIKKENCVIKDNSLEESKNSLVRKYNCISIINKEREGHGNILSRRFKWIKLMAL